MTNGAFPMILEKGNMWSVFDSTDIFMITTNPIRRKDGAVVMGRGIALEAKTKYPTLPHDFGNMLETYPNNIGLIGHYDYTRIYWFMVKHHWRDRADLEVIKKSVTELRELLEWSDERVDMNFPGIGNGKLKREDVLPVLQTLPDNVHVWEYA